MTTLEDPRGIWVKVDGVTRPEDASAAADAGVSAIGMIFAPSPRQVTIEQAEVIREAIPDSVTAFGVFESADGVQEAVERLRLGGVQLAGMAPVLPGGTLVLRTIHVAGADDLFGAGSLPCDAIHLDAYVEGKLGGTGTLAPWDVIERYRPRKPFILSGGLTADNVADAVRRVRPDGVDVSSGVESEPGVKDHGKLRAFVEAARSAV